MFTTLESKHLSTQSPRSTALNFQSALRPAREPRRFVLLMPHPGPSRCHRGHFSVTHQPTVSRSFTSEPLVLSTNTCWEHKTIRGSQRTRRDHDGCSRRLPVLTYKTRRNAGHTMPTPRPPRAHPSCGKPEGKEFQARSLTPWEQQSLKGPPQDHLFQPVGNQDSTCLVLNEHPLYKNTREDTD